nr:EAL domain-containing protein [Peribacillus kribbensis]
MLSEKERSIVQSVIAMSHGLDLLVVAEGVEEIDQYKLMQSLHCGFVKRYYLGRPVPFDKVRDDFLKTTSRQILT